MNMTITWISFIIYGVAMLYIGYRGMVKTRTLTDYYVSGRKDDLLMSVPLFAASFISASSIVSYTGFAYANGWMLFLIYGTGVAGGWIMLQIISSRMYSPKFEYSTSADLYCARYYEDAGFLRGFTGIFNMLVMLFYVVIGFTGIGTILEVFLNVNYAVGVLICSFIFLTYTVMGGSKSVGWTNQVQFVMLFIGIVVIGGVVLKMVGGLGALNSTIATLTNANGVTGYMHTFTSGGTISWTRIIGVSIGIIFMCPIASYYHRIFFSTRSKKVCGSFIGISALLLMLVYGGLVVIGLGAAVLSPGLANQEQAFPTIVTMLPPVFAAIAVVAIISAIQSTMDNQLLCAGSMISNDIYKKLINPQASDEKLMKLARNATLTLGIVATIIAVLRPALVLSIYNLIMVISPTVLFPCFFLGLFWKRATKEAAYVTLIFGAVAGGAWALFGPPAIPCTLVIMPINIILMVVVSLMTPKPPQATVDLFFNR